MVNVDGISIRIKTFQLIIQMANKTAIDLNLIVVRISSQTHIHRYNIINNINNHIYISSSEQIGMIQHMVQVVHLTTFQIVFGKWPLIVISLIEGIWKATK